MTLYTVLNFGRELKMIKTFPELPSKVLREEESDLSRCLI